MRIPIVITLIAAAVVLIAVLIGGQMLIQPPQSLITHAGFLSERITPNADGQDDVTIFEYGLSRNAQISIALVAEDGTSYFFRQNEARGADDDYGVQFSGVVDGFTLPGETFEGQVMRRLLPDGTYTWRLTAETEAGERDERSGTLEIANGDTTLPLLTSFTVSPEIFTPNQDGVADRVQMTVVMEKDAELVVYLQDEAGTRFFVPEREDEIPPGEAGRHMFDYEGGVDQGADPPPDGTYTVIAEAQDAVGQRMRQESVLTIQYGGNPLAQIIGQPTGPDVAFAMRPDDPRYAEGELVEAPEQPEDFGLSALTMPVGDLLVFRLTVENYSNVPIRTTGPQPGTVYNQDEVAATLGWIDESGAWRVGLDCDTASRDYPWRWAIGAPDDLVAEVDPTSGNTYYYLPPGERAVVWGAVRMTEINDARNPQACWAGLIHEDVKMGNNRVGPRDIELVEVGGRHN